MQVVNDDVFDAVRGEVVHAEDRLWWTVADNPFAGVARSIVHEVDLRGLVAVDLDPRAAELLDETHAAFAPRADACAAADHGHVRAAVLEQVARDEAPTAEVVARDLVARQLVEAPVYEHDRKVGR
jgi:hypothetical protein